MSLAELKEEEERMFKTLNVKKTREVRKKIEACPIKFDFAIFSCKFLWFVLK